MNLFRFLVFFSLCFLTCSCGSNPDYPILQAFRSSSDTRKSLSSWNSGNPCAGSWTGITCNNKGRVTHLVLQNTGLTGNIKTLTGLDQLRVLSLKNNSLSSSLPDLSPWKNMKLLYLSHNQFSGQIPDGISNLRRLKRLDLSHNNLTGHISPELNMLPLLLTLRLEQNYLSGTLLSLNLTKKLQNFNVSNNFLVGEIPGSLSSLPESAFVGNLDLCGSPLQFQCLNSTVTSNPSPVSRPISVAKPERKLGRTAIMAIVVSQAVLLLALVGFFIYICWGNNRVQERRKKQGEQRGAVYSSSPFTYAPEEESDRMVFFEGSKRFRLDDLLRASAEMLGKGSIGTSYRATMENGVNFVVKRLREKINGRDCERHLQLLGSLKNPHVVSLRAYYHSKDETLLIYDFLPNGSLHSLLHGNRGPGRTPLDWTTRLKLALGSAKGLDVFHRSCKSKLCHGNVTSTNILVDRNGNACISDFALYQLLPSNSSWASNPPLFEAYRAPELVNGKKPSQKSDVYGFGVVLLEILTGKMAREGEVGLAKWVQCVVREEWTSEVFDLELLRFKELEEEMVGLLQVAMLCLAPAPQNRPKMSLVLKMIEELRVRGYRSPSRDFSSDSSSPSLSENTLNTTSN